MKKEVLCCHCIAAIAIATFVGTKAFKSNVSENNYLLMANVEALSQSNDANVGKVDCYNAIKIAKGCLVVYCPNCTIVPGKGQLGSEGHCYAY